MKKTKDDNIFIEDDGDKEFDVSLQEDQDSTTEDLTSNSPIEDGLEEETDN